jgi:DNA repair protein RadA/Sms
VAQTQAPTRVSTSAPARAAQPIREVDPAEAKAVPTGLGELDRVLGSGLTPGGVVLLAGEPGVGKSTLLLAVASRWAQAGRKVLYVSAEESAAQVGRRAQRIGALADGLFLASEQDLSVVLGHIEEVAPSLLVLDSVQTVSVPGGDGVPGGVTQVKEVTQALVRVAKQRGLAVLLVGHVTKEGAVAGPRTLEHLVDVVLTFEGDKHSELRIVRASKNRFGPADEIGCFEMTERGIAEVGDPSGLFVSHHDEPACGSCLTVAVEGRRPLLTELQALVAASAAQSPRRVANGVDAGRLSLLLAVLGRRAKVKLGHKEVYVSTIGGAKTTDPAADLAIAVAVAAAAGDEAFARPLVALGEVGLSGEVRRVSGLERRLAEAARLGVTLALVPAGSRVKVPGLEVVEVSTLAQALAILGVRKKARLEAA